MAAEVPPEDRGVLAPHQTPQPRELVPGRGVPTTAGCEHQQGHSPCEMEDCRRPRHLLKGPKTHSLTNTCPKFQLRDSSLKSFRDIPEGAKLTGFRARGGGSRTQMLAGTTIPMLSLLPTQTAGAVVGKGSLNLSLYQPG